MEKKDKWKYWPRCL